MNNTTAKVQPTIVTVTEIKVLVVGGETGMKCHNVCGGFNL